jgi:hypothetical protein
VLAVASGDVADVVNRAGAGAAARPGDVADIDRAVRELIALTPLERAALGARAHAFYSTEMSQAVGSARLSALLESAAAGPTPRQGER